MQDSYSHIHGQNCSCSSCFYQNTSEKPSVQDMVAGGSKIDKLFLGKFIPMREQKLLDRLARTRAVYDDIRNQLLPEGDTGVDLEPETDRLVDNMKKEDTSSAIFKLVNLIDKGGYAQTSLSDCCSSCSCDVILRQRGDAGKSFKGRARVPEAYPYRRSHIHLQQRQNVRHQDAALKRRTGPGGQHQLHERHGHAHYMKHIRSDPCGCHNLRHKRLMKRVSKAFSRLSRTELSRSSLQRYLSGEFTKRGQHMKKGHHYKEWGEIGYKTGITTRKSATKIKQIKRKVKADAKKSLHKINDSKDIIKDSVINSLKKVKRGYKMTDTELADLYESSFDIPLHNRDNMDHDEIMNKWACEDCDPEECVSAECFHNKKLKAKARHSKKYPDEISNMSISVDYSINVKPKQTSIETETFETKSAAVKVKRGRYQSLHGKLKRSITSSGSDIGIQSRPKKATLSTYTKNKKLVAEKVQEEHKATGVEARYKNITLGTKTKKEKTTVAKFQRGLDVNRDSKHAKQQFKAPVASSASGISVQAKTKNIKLGPETNTKKTAVKRAQKILNDDSKLVKYRLKKSITANASDLGIQDKKNTLENGTENKTTKSKEKVYKGRKEILKAANQQSNNTVISLVTDIGVMARQNEGTLSTVTKKEKAVVKDKKNSTVILVHQGQRSDIRKGYKQPSINISVRGKNRQVTKAEELISKGKLNKPLTSSAGSPPCECKVALKPLLHWDADEQNIDAKVRSPKEIQLTASHIPSRHSQVGRKPKINISRGHISATQHQHVKVKRPSSSMSDRQVEIAVRPKINTRRQFQGVLPGVNRQSIRISSTSTSSKELDKKPKTSRDKNVHQGRKSRKSVSRTRSNFKTSITSHRKNKTANTAYDLKRCFCTLQLKSKRKKRKDLPNGTRHQLIGISERTLSQTSKSMQTVQSKLKKSKAPHPTALLPYECEPMICVPDNCDPLECIKLIQKQNIKRHSTHTSTAYTFDRSVSTPSFTPKTSTIGVNETRPSTAATATASHDTLREPVIKLDGESSSRRQTVRISSSFSFNIDFYRGDYPNQVHTLETSDTPRKETSKFKIKTTDKNANTMQSGNLSRKNKNTQNKRNMQINKSSRQRKVGLGHTSSQISSSGKSKDKGTKYNLRRCFCTLKLAKQRDAATNIRKYQTFSNHFAGTADLSVKSAKVAQAAEKGTEKKNNQKIIQKLLAHECEPGICIPGECNPFECQKFFNIKNKKMVARGSRTESTKSKSAHSITNTRVSSKSNDVQSGILTTKRSVNVQRQHKVRKPRAHKVSQLNLQRVLSSPSNRQAVRMGSNFSFNVEFFKCKSPRQAEVLTKDTPPGFHVTSTPRFDSRSQPSQLTQHQRQTMPFRERASQEIIDNITINSTTARVKPKKKGVLNNSAIKRCFCNLMLKKAQHMTAMENNTVNVEKKYAKPKNSTRGTTGTKNTMNRGDNPSKISIRGHKSQSNIVKKNKATRIRPILKRCFCSLRLQNKAKSNIRPSRHIITTAMPAQIFYKNYNMWKTNKEEVKYSSKNTLSSNASYMLNSSSEQSGQEIKSKSKSFIKRIFSSIFDYSHSNLMRQNNQFLKSNFYAMNVQIQKQQKRKHKLQKYECEPGVCVPGDCNPLECVKRIHKRSTRRVSTSTSPGYGYGYTRMSRSKSVSSETARHNVTGQKNATAQCTRKPLCKTKRCVSSFRNERYNHTLAPSNKQAVRISSNFSFYLEFSKAMATDRFNTADIAKADRSKQRKPCIACTGTSCDNRTCITKCTNVCKAKHYNRESQSSTTMYNKGSMIKPKYSRCLCTLDLLNKRKDGIQFNMREISPKNIIKLSTRGQNTKKSKNNDIKNQTFIKQLQRKNGMTISQAKLVHHRLQMGALNLKPKISSVGSLMKRCLCTLKLQNVGKKQKQSEHNVKPKLVTAFENHSATTKMNINAVIHKKTGINSINKKICADLYECEPGVYIPGQCDPYKCLKRMRKQGKVLKSACTMCEPMCTHKRCVAIGCNLLPKCSKKLIQPRAPRIAPLPRVKKMRSSDLLMHLSESRIKSQLLSNDLHERQGVKYGSNVSFDIEFYKKNLYPNHVSVPDNSKNTKHSRTGIYDKNIDIIDADVNRFKKHNDTNTQYQLRNNAVQAKYGTRTKDSVTGNLLQRCFCTEKLRPSRKKHERKHIVTVGHVQEFRTLSPFKPSRYSYGKESCRCLRNSSKRTKNKNEESMYNDKLQKNMINRKPLIAIINPMKANSKVKKQSRRKTVSIQDPAEKEYTVMLGGKELARNVSAVRDPHAKAVLKVGAADVDVQYKHDKIINTCDSKHKNCAKTYIGKVAAENNGEKTTYKNSKENTKFCTQTKLNMSKQNRTDCKLLNHNNTSGSEKIIHKKLPKKHLVLPSAVCGKTPQNSAFSKDILPRHKENKRKHHLKQLIATVIAYVKGKRNKMACTKITRVLNKEIIKNNKKPQDYTVVKISGENLSKNISSLHDSSGSRPVTAILTIGGTEEDFEVKRPFSTKEPHEHKNHHLCKCNTTCCKCAKDKRIPKKMNAKDNIQKMCAGDNINLKNMETILPYRPRKYKNNCSRTCSSTCACSSCLCSKTKRKQVFPPCKRNLHLATGQTYEKMTVFQRILSFFSDRKYSNCESEKDKTYHYVGNRRNFNSIKRSRSEKNVREYYQPQRSNSALIHNENRKQTKCKYFVNTLFPNRKDLKCRNDIDHIISLNKEPKKIKRSKSERETQCICFTELYQPKRCKSAKILQCDIRDVGDPMNDIYRKIIKQRYHRSKFRKAHSPEFLIEPKILCDGPELTKTKQSKRVKFALDPVIAVEKPIGKKAKMPKKDMGAVNTYIKNQNKCNSNHGALRGKIQKVVGDINTNYTAKAAPQKKDNINDNYIEVKISGKKITKSICQPKNPKQNTLVTVSGSYIGCEISKKTGTVTEWKGKCIKHNCAGYCPYCNIRNDKSKYSSDEKNKDKSLSIISKNRETHSIIGSSKDIPDRKPRIKGYREIRVKRGSCRCCICNRKIEKEKVLQTKKKPKTYLCGSSKCAKQLKKDEAQKAAVYKLKSPTRIPCICGTPACSSLAALAHSDTVTLLKKLYRYMAMNNSCKCGSNVCDCVNYLEQLKKKQEKQIKNQKMLEKLRIDRYNSDRKRIARQKRYDNYMTRKTKQNKNADGALLWAESIMDMTKLGVNATTGVTRCVYRALTDPEQTKIAVKTAVKQPRRGIAVCMQGFRNSGVPAALKRIKMRFGNMLPVRLLKKGMETFALTNYMLHFSNPDPTQRLKRIKKKRKIKKKEPLDFGCSPYMASLRKRPCLYIYFTCPWFYPHFISLITLWRQFTDVILFLLAVVVWSPCLLTLEVLRFFFCCCLCTA